MSASRPAAAPPLILASASPRRAQLLREAGYEFQVVTPPYDDTEHSLEHLPAHLAAPALAELKAASVADGLPRGLVLGCDTLIAQGDHRIGKPADAADARRILNLLIGAKHQAITAVCLIDAGSKRRCVFTDVADVVIPALPAGELERYLAAGEWRGKAGGYNLAELQRRWNITVTGDPTTVVGLPMRRLAAELGHFAPSDT